MPADPYTVVEEALRDLPESLRHDVDVVTGTAVRALLAAGYLTDHDCARHAIDTGQLDRLGYINPDSPQRLYTGDAPLPGDEWVYRLAATSEEAGT